MKKSYWVAIGFSGLAILSIAWIAYLLAVVFLSPTLANLLPAPRDDVWMLMTVAVSATCIVVSTIGTAATILFGWRNDRRQIEELRMKLQQAEAQRVATAGTSN